jgi:hypothetical protein
MTAECTVLYIAGSGRSGSTLLGNVLGQLPGWVHVGELRHLFDEGLRDHGPCGCGAPVPECVFWTAVMQRAFGVARPDLPTLIELERAATSVTRALGRWRGDRRAGPAARFAEVLGRLYVSIAEVAHAQVIVDGSKRALFGMLAQAAPGIRLRVLHLIRDPRAVAYSGLRRRRHAHTERRGFARLASLLRTQLEGTARDLIVELIWRRDRRVPSRLLRYEDLMADPRAGLEAVAGDLGCALPPGFVGPDRSVSIAACHAVSGNPMRFRTGPVVLALDDEWRTALGAGDRLIVDLCAFPSRLLHGYGGRGGVRNAHPGS